jgi:hypothetical protein
MASERYFYDGIFLVWVKIIIGKEGRECQGGKGGGDIHRDSGIKNSEIIKGMDWSAVHPQPERE